uniref:EML-like first beta-propeller domain-containing protein n=1 Tax=Hanusia phi TaxID=3032 RepID=A0A6T7PC66_9CRYP
MDRPQTLTRADTTRRQTPTFQRPISRPASSRPFGSAPAPRPSSAGVRHRPIDYDYLTGSTFSVKVKGKPVFLLGDFRKKVDKNVKNSRFVSAFKESLQEQTADKKKQDMIRDQYEKRLVRRFQPVEHTETGLTKVMLGLDTGDDKEAIPTQGEIGNSRIDEIESWENSQNGGLEKYRPCVNSVFAPAQFHGCDYTDPQWQREPSSHLSLDFVYGYHGSSSWDWDLFGIGPGLNNLNFIEFYDTMENRCKYSGEIVYFTAATVVVYDVFNNIQRFFYHSDDVTSMALLIRMHQRGDGSWIELDQPLGPDAAQEWSHWFTYNKGVHVPSEKSWTADMRTLPVHTDEYPNKGEDGKPYDWKNWDIPNRCIVASGQMGRNPRIYVWRIPLYRGDQDFSTQVLAQLSLGRKRRQVSALSFNGNGRFLSALSEDLDHSILVFDWRKEEPVREAKGHGGLVDCMLFNPYGDRAFASCGEKHLKFWEMGDVEVEMAVGLFGDIGETLSQKCMTFHPRGNTISGVENGDVYIWSNGVVNAKIEKAHKKMVTSVKWVEDVGLFTCGVGGLLKIWDPDLKDTKKPICIIDLNSFHTKGSPNILKKLAGRSMDWTTSPEILRELTDDAFVENRDERGVSGAPATHMSFADLKCDGVLLLGTTMNSIIALGFAKVAKNGSWASKGLGGDYEIEGYSAGTKKGSLSKQVWWNHEKVEAFKGKYGAAKGHIPVAVYSYQSFDPAQPGYRHKSGNESSALTCPWQLAVCGKKILMNSHMCDIDAVAPMPNQRIFATASKDCTVRLWDIDDQVMIDSFYAYYPCQSITWWSKQTKDGPVVEEEVFAKKQPILAVGHENGNFSIWRMEINSTEAAEQDENAIEDDPFYNPEDAFGKIQLCCINPLPRMVAKVDLNRKSSEQAFCLRYSPDGRYFSVGLGDNCLDIYEHAIVPYDSIPARDGMLYKSKLKGLGATDEEIRMQDCLPYKRVGCFNDHSSAVLSVDFDVESTIFRSVSASNEILFGVLPLGKMNTSTQECSTKRFATQTCKLGWSVKSIWACGSNATDINAVDLSKSRVPPWAPCHGGPNPSPWPWTTGYVPTASSVPIDKHLTPIYPGEGDGPTWGHQVLVSAQDDGRVKLFRYPVFGFKQAFRSYLGHGSHVMDARFSYDDDYVISVGGRDVSIFQWRHVIPNKIYVQNLPDGRDERGNFLLDDYTLKNYLKDFFVEMLKVDVNSIAEIENMRGNRELKEKDLNETSEEWKKNLDSINQALQNCGFDEQVSARRSVLKQVALSKFNPSRSADVPNRTIVSIQVFGSGAANQGDFFPDSEKGRPISSRWATVVFKTQEEADEVCDLYGCGRNFFLSYRQLIDEGMIAPSCFRIKQPLHGSVEASENFVTAAREKDKLVYSEWKEFDDSYYSRDCLRGRSGSKHFLYITAGDPNEQTSMYDIEKLFRRVRFRLEKDDEYQLYGHIDPERQMRILYNDEVNELQRIKVKMIEMILPNMVLTC